MRTGALLDDARRLLPIGTPLTDRSWRRRQRWMTVVLVAHIAGLTVLLAAVGYAPLAMLSALLPIVATTGLSVTTRFSRRTRTLLATFALVASSSLLVHATDGLIESHFHFFVVISLVTLYQEWMAFAVAFSYVVVHHGVVGVLAPTSVYNHEAAWNRPVLWAFIHGGYVAVAAVANLIAWRLNEDERRRTAQVLSATGEAIYGIDDSGRITFANAAMAQLTGRTIGELENQHHHTVLGHRDADARPHALDNCPVCADVVAADGRLREDQLFTRSNGAQFPVEYASHPVRERAQADGLAVVVNFRDISERRAFEHELNRQALHDQLTGLPNRTLLLDRVGLALAGLREQPYMAAVVFCNVNRFKRINASFGHDVADAFLKQLAGRLCAVVRPDETVARVGSDEFVVCCPTVPNEDAGVRIAERIRAVFDEPFTLGGTTVHIDASVGVACASDAEMSSAALIRQADQAMRTAKATGVGLLVHEPTMAVAAAEEVLLEEELRGALDHRQLEVYYQPTIELATSRIVGFEALLRWNHPEHGLVAPGTFIPVAERCGLIVPIGQWVLHESCGQIAAWNRDRPTPLTVGINVSARQLQQPGFVDDVVRALEDTGCDPTWLLLEIAETVLIGAVETTAPLLPRLRELGIRVALDDFGTGYSSLTYLRQIPVDSLKIDRSFVTDLGTRPDQRSLIGAVVNMARSLSMNTIAEGVELEDERDALVHLGCDLAQGFYYARPLPRDDAARLLVDPSAMFAPAVWPSDRSSARADR